ncbi:MAG: TlpA family protein disulfide reductase [Actinobacteria bacterium]|nr:TlpA family protein disulfide reductase [Actinomycetota bacterium]
MKTRRLGIVTVAVVVLAVALVLATGCGSSDGGGDVAGDGAAVELLSPDDFDLASYAGEPLVVNFFGSWCGPCNLEAPDLATFARQSAARIVGIAVNDTEDDARSFMAEYGLSFPVVMDDNRLGAEYGVTGVPTTIFFDAQGQETDRLIGASSLDQFNAALAASQ